MSCKILIVEDEYFVAAEIEFLISEMGHEPVGVAADQPSAMRLADAAEVALVDINLQDGPTGISIGQSLAERHGVTVLFMTANPSQLGDQVPGTLGVLSKPVSERELKQAVAFAVARHRAEPAELQPPKRMRLFGGTGQAAAM